MNFDASNINPDLDETIDVGSVFDNLSTREALNRLLLISNSVMIINDAGDMIVKSRKEDETKSVVNLFGKSDELGRENIVSISDYNTGRHRMFNSLTFNTQTKSNNAIGQQFGERVKKINEPAITDATKEATIAQRLLDEFKAPKIELRLRVSTALANTMEVLDRVSVNYPLRIGKPAPGNFLPVIGVTEIGEANSPLPKQFGARAIPPVIAFKVLRITDFPKTFVSELKLRQIGTELNDGQYNNEGNCIVGFAVIGSCKIADGDTDPFNPSVIGAAKIGETKTA